MTKEASSPPAWVGGGGGGGGGSTPALCPTAGDLPGCSWDETNAPQAGLCCYQYDRLVVCGRPFLVDGAARVAATAGRTDWIQASVAGEALAMGDATRVALGQAWLEDALLEHASVASFARFALHLLALGAPPALVLGAQQAMGDEVRHAQGCFALASRYAGQALGPSGMALDGSLRTPTLAEAAASAVHEGCVGETLAALQARAQLEGAVDPEVRRTLAQIAEDEAVHAELAWAFVRWALVRGGEPVRAAVEEAFAASFAKVMAAAGEDVAGMAAAGGAAAGAVDVDDVDDVDVVDMQAWRAHGRLTAKEQARCHREAMEEVLMPCAQALLASAGRGARSKETTYEA
ncbi:ferritin-like domain-containing protein [Chondromyces apiculatus]|uniref:Uncharacterized protein n=1 Tax=Chondromyces apiculatus DSM 436 TaxID=1192034 RepID=A0A017SXE8_9BACT|nr:ferritin-like domain-containing protein [Chondromyces apiculatus]EYF01649.1 Hypothetical protein CAP_7968 [Chondromyces apiculatus DSM 436]